MPWPCSPLRTGGRTPSKVGQSSSKAVVQVGSAAWERALDQVQAIMPTTATKATPMGAKEGLLATPHPRPTDGSQARRFLLLQCRVRACVS